MGSGLHDIEEAAARAVKKIEAYGWELHARERELLEENRRLNEEARARRLAREAEAKAEHERERARVEGLRRKEEEKRLKGAMRERFLSANPTATVADFERLWLQLRDECFKREAETSRERQERALLADGIYSNVL
jgi:hypothetical protein